ncbi:MAG: BCCT family transporter [Firmicutes bacterium]|nr:BCCT family transporter [Bacillota bacterium]
MTGKNLDWAIMLVPLGGILGLAALVAVRPEQSFAALALLRDFFGNQLGAYYIVVGVGVFLASLYMAFSRYGNLVLGKIEKPRYSNLKWGLMVFSATMGADIIYWSLIEWAYYFNEPRISQIGGPQNWASTYPLFHWGPIPWSFYISLAVVFGFMLHVRENGRQKISETCRPLLGSRVDGFWGKAINLVAVFGLLAGTTTTLGVVMPLLSAIVTRITGIPASLGLTLAILFLITLIYTLAVWFGIEGISKLATVCATMFGALLLYVLLAGGETRYIVETGIQSLGNLAQNFLSLATWIDPLRNSGSGGAGFTQTWTVFYWSYWMVWCIATPLFIGTISQGRTIRSTVLGGYAWGLAGTFASFMILGNFGLAQQMRGTLEIASRLQEGEGAAMLILDIFQRLPLQNAGLMLLAVTMVMFYTTVFDALTLVLSTYSYKQLQVLKEPDKKVRTFWALLFTLLPAALIFSEGTLSSLQTVPIIAAFPIGTVIILAITSFFRDARKVLDKETSIYEESEVAVSQKTS